MAIQLDGSKMLARGTAVKNEKAKCNIYHTHWDFDMYTSPSIDAIESNQSGDEAVNDSTPSDIKLDA